MTHAIDEALRWRINRMTSEAVQHRQKADVHRQIADDLDVKIIEYRQLLRSLTQPITLETP